MYLYEDSVQAVRLYLNLGKRIKATVGQFGYPTKNSLKAWQREYEQSHALRTAYVRAAPRYSAEHKQAAVDSLSHERCAAATLRALGFPSRGTLAAWIDELYPAMEKRLVGRVAGSGAKSLAVKRAAVIELCAREESTRVVA